MKKEKISVLGSNTLLVLDIIPPEQDAVAIFVPAKNIIVIDERSDDKFVDFCHELFHLLVHRSGVKQSAGWSSDCEEILAENFSVMIKENLKDILRIKKKLEKK